MRTALDCVPCLVRQTLDSARFVTADPAVHERLLREVLREMATMDMAQSPPAMAQRIHRILRSLTGVADPYRAVKQRFNRMALDMVPELAAAIRNAEDPLAMAVRVAIAGNVIDLGVSGGIGLEDARRSIRNVLDEPFVGDVAAFRE
ncbi:MAG: DUF89 family protein, partial [Lentisphaeria bacterium]|nr:DUF89 family protein [Lentisphaeria bacterium]